MLREFIASLQSYGRALRLVNSMRLWPFMILPGIISFILAALVGLLAWTVSDNIGNWMFAWYPWEWGADVVLKIGQILSVLAILFVGYIIFKNLIIVLLGPFLSPLSETIESRLTGQKVGASFLDVRYNLSLMIRGLRLALRNIIRELFYTFLLLLLGLFPVFSIFSPVVIFMIQSYYAGFGNMDFTMERFLTVRESIEFVRKHKGMATGNGLVYMLLLSTGVGVFFCPTLGTIAGTMDCLKVLYGPEIEENIKLYL